MVTRHAYAPSSRVGRAFLVSQLDGNLTRPMAAMFTAGGVQALVIMAMPHWAVEHPAILIGAGVASLATGLALWLSVRRLPRWCYHLLLLSATAMVSAGVLASGSEPVSMSAAYFYWWIVLFAFAFLPVRVAAGHLVVVAVFYAGALALDPAPAYPAQWLQAMLGLCVTGLVLGGFAADARRLATTDQLTGLPNRRCLDSVLPREVERSRRSVAEPLSIAVMDLDGFKAINDTHGHQAGDDMLSELGAAWVAALRGHDLVARLGGDEFLLVAPGADETGAASQVERLRQLLPASVGLSAGVAQLTDLDDADALLRRADLALYRAKHRARGSTHHASDAAPVADARAG